MRKSILKESMRNLTIYTLLFFVLILSVGGLILKHNYDNEIENLEKEYRAEIKLDTNKYIQEELKNIKNYLDTEYTFLTKAAEEIVNNYYEIVVEYYKNSENKDQAIKFLQENASKFITVKVVDEINNTNTHYAKYLQLENKKLLKIKINDKKYKDYQSDIALKNIMNLHNKEFAFFTPSRLADDFEFPNSDWFCENRRDKYICFDKNWWISIEYRINTSNLEEKLNNSKDKSFDSYIDQFLFFLCALLSGFFGLYMYVSRKKIVLEKQIKLVENNFDIALNKQIFNLDKDKKISQELVYSEFRTLSYALLRLIRKIDIRDKELNKIAYNDKLTGLMNMTNIKKHLKVYRQKEDKVLLFLLFNIENFRICNLMYGREFGDEILKVVGFRLYCELKNITIQNDEHNECLDFIKSDKYRFNKNGDSFECLARVSADEYLLIIELDKNEDFSKIAQKYLNMLSKNNIKINSSDELVNYEPFRISARVGYSVYPNDSENIFACISNADLAMRNKNDNDGNIFVYDAQIGKDNENNLQLLQDIRNAILNKEFILHYQPKVDCKTDKIIGAEALVRWQKGNDLIMPDDFIKICEENNLIIALGDEIIKMACNMQRKLTSLGYKLKLSINLSTKQLLNDAIVQTIRKNLEGIDPKLIEFEITENFSIENLTDKKIIDDIKDLNVSLSMDDFGKGYSSLSYLNDDTLDFDVVKIDKSFIQNISNNSQNKELVKHIINIIKAVGKHTVAEGVENKETLDYLKELGCDEYQGYFFSKPIPESDFLERLKSDNN